jgi:hypothetical protein
MEQQQPNFHTGFLCDRCGNPTAIRYMIATRRDYKGDPIKEDIDLCHRCVMSMTSSLLNRIPDDERQRWIKSFIQGIIRR